MPAYENDLVGDLRERHHRGDRARRIL